MASLKAKTGNAALWQVAGGGWQTIVRLGASIYLARALSPSDFGLFGIALLYQEFILTILQIGFGTGIIVKKKLSQEDLNTSFWLSCFTKSTIFLAIFLSAPLAARFWQDERLEAVIRAISVTVLIQIIGSVPGLLAVKRLNFKIINIIRGIGVFLESIIAVFLVAIMHITYWALVIGMIVNVFFYNTCLWIANNCWLPKMEFNKASFKYLFKFGFYAWLVSIINYLKENIDYIVVSRLLGTYMLGLYEFAYRLPHIVLYRVSSPISSVLFPAFCEVQNDNEKLISIYVESVKYVLLVVLPVLFGMIAVSDILVKVLWGDKWLSIIRPLQILSLYAAFRNLFLPITSLFNSKSRPDIPFKISFVEFFVTVISVTILGYNFGLIGVSFGVLLSVLPLFFLVNFYLKKIFNKNLFKVISENSPVLLSSFFSSVSAFLIKKMLLKTALAEQITLVISILIGGIMYILSIFILRPDLVKSAIDNFKVIVKKT